MINDDENGANYWQNQKLQEYENWLNDLDLANKEIKQLTN